MVRRPKEWENWTKEKRIEWLRTQRIERKAGRRVLLTESDAPRIWRLLKQYENKSIVADLEGVSSRTIRRFVKRNPIPESFVVKEDMNLSDYPEIKTWLKRMEAFAKQNTINNYLCVLREFYAYMKEKHPERARPSLWTSDHVNEFVYSFKSHLWHWAIVPLRSLALKAQEEFPNIDLGLLPTKRTHKAKRSLAGKKEYYFTPEQIANMIEVASTKKAKAIIAFLYNTACRVTGLINARVENLKLHKHMVKITDKFSITWVIHGLTEKTCQLLREYLEERGNPRKGWLFTNSNSNRLTKTQVNEIIRDAGHKAKIKDKVLTSKSFRKSFVQNALDNKISPMSLIGTGKEVKTCMCVGWNSDTIFKHYAPEMLNQIEEDRQKLLF